jgi:hypothetical protein
LKRENDVVYAFIMISIILNFLVALTACGLFVGRIIISPTFR